MDGDELLRIKREHWKVVEPSVTISFATGGSWRCPDERCGEDRLGLRISHPRDPERTPNRCPTCLCTAVEIAASPDEGVDE